MWQTKPYRHAVELQELVMSTSRDAEAKDVAALAKSFVALEMLKLRLRMKPAPKPVDVSKLQKPSRQAKAQSQFAEE